MKKALIVGIFFLVILHIIVAVFFVTNYFNWDNDFNLNRSDRMVTDKNYYYQYPFSGPPHIVYNGTDVSGLPTFSVEIEIQYTGLLVEGSPLFLAAQGFLYPDGQQNISGIQVGYQGASWYSFIANYPAYFDVNLTNTNVYSMIMPGGSTLGINIKWDTQGEYYPFVVLNFKNGSNPITLPLDGLKAHVYGLEAIQQQNDGRRTIGTETSLFLFAVLDITATIVGYFSKVKRTKKKRPQPTQPNPREQTYREIQRNKKRTEKQTKNKRESDNVDSVQKENQT